MAAVAVGVGSLVVEVLPGIAGDLGIEEIHPGGMVLEVLGVPGPCGAGVKHGHLTDAGLAPIVAPHSQGLGLVAWVLVVVAAAVVVVVAVVAVVAAFLSQLQQPGFVVAVLPYPLALASPFPDSHNYVVWPLH